MLPSETYVIVGTGKGCRAVVNEYAYKVLDVYSYFDSKPGSVLLANSFVAVGERREWPMTGLQEGLEEANRIGWIEEATRGWRLTETGYQEASKRS